MWGAVQGTWGTPQHRQVKQLLRGWSPLWSCSEMSPSYVPALGFCPPRAAQGKGSEDSRDGHMNISPHLSDSLSVSRMAKSPLSLQLQGPGAGPGVRGHRDTLQEAGWELGTMVEDGKAQHRFWAAEMPLPWGTATSRSALSWQGVQFPVRQRGETTQLSPPVIGSSSSVAWRFLHPQLLHRLGELSSCFSPSSSPWG